MAARVPASAADAAKVHDLVRAYAFPMTEGQNLKWLFAFEFGSKRIKGIAVKGGRATPLADPERTLELARDLSKRSLGPGTAKYRELGTVTNLRKRASRRPTMAEGPVFIVGQATGLIVYVRNLYLIHRARGEDASREAVESAKPLTE